MAQPGIFFPELPGVSKEVRQALPKAWRRALLDLPLPGRPGEWGWFPGDKAQAKTVYEFLRLSDFYLRVCVVFSHQDVEAAEAQAAQSATEAEATRILQVAVARRVQLLRLAGVHDPEALLAQDPACRFDTERLFGNFDALVATSGVHTTFGDVFTRSFEEVWEHINRARDGWEAFGAADDGWSWTLVQMLQAVANMENVLKRQVPATEFLRALLDRHERERRDTGESFLAPMRWPPLVRVVCLALNAHHSIEDLKGAVANQMSTVRPPDHLGKGERGASRYIELYRLAEKEGLSAREIFERRPELFLNYGPAAILLREIRQAARSGTGHVCVWGWEPAPDFGPTLMAVSIPGRSKWLVWSEIGGIKLQRKTPEGDGQRKTYDLEDTLAFFEDQIRHWAASTGTKSGPNKTVTAAREKVTRWLRYFERFTTLPPEICPWK